MKRRVGVNFGAYLANSSKKGCFEEEKCKDTLSPFQKEKFHWAEKQWEKLMEEAFQQARLAEKRQEVPVGAALMDREGRILASEGNQVLAQDNPMAHAEMLVLEKAVRQYGSAFLRQTALAVTLEPCPLCAAAIGALKIQALSFAAYDPKGGAVEHGPRLFNHSLPYASIEIFGGICERESSQMLKKFFKHLR